MILWRQTKILDQIIDIVTSFVFEQTAFTTVPYEPYPIVNIGMNSLVRSFGSFLAN